MDLVQIEMFDLRCINNIQIEYDGKTLFAHVNEELVLHSQHAKIIYIVLSEEDLPIDPKIALANQ
jgi:2-C-methyl-D-erythritol 4-phosphate cytidylyltransferase